ncbi:MAG: arginase family protein [Candidatus Lokiarchaeota archaeon]|nr:arginase family protein [Candidatus Lokiarchaeota archaeon]
MRTTFFDYGEIMDENTEFFLFGIPWDYLTSIALPNSAIAPDKIREVTKDLALTTELGQIIPEFKVADIGNVPIEQTEINKNIEAIQDFIHKALEVNKNAIAIMIGGDHFCSYPVIKAIGDSLESKEKFGVLIFDSHLDLYEEWDKGKFSHATISHRVMDLEYISNKNLFIVGTRDIDIPELEIASNENVAYLNAYLLYEMGLEAYAKRIIDFFEQTGVKNLYISIDIDALDPSIAPGTGFAIPGGFTYRELWILLKTILARFTPMGFDVVEVAPNLDLKNNITCNTAAKLIVEIISFINNKKKK